MVYIYCARGSDGARDLAAWLNANECPAKRTRRKPPNLRTDDLVLNWGSTIPAGNRPCRFLNERVQHDKRVELVRLLTAGVPTPRVRLTPAPGYLARVRNHTKARDLLAGLTHGDYYTQYVPVEREFRIHVWNGRCMRSGQRVKKDNTAHPRFRSLNAGWKIDYGADRPPQTAYTAAKAAVAALGYDFGAVDVGVKADGAAVVFEVNSAPGLHGNTVEAYGRKIKEAARAN